MVNETRYQIDLTARLVSLGIGNQWILADHIVIGADWLVYPVYQKSEYSYDVLSNPGSLSESELESLFKKAVDGIEVSSGLQIVAFYLGITF